MLRKKFLIHLLLCCLALAACNDTDTSTQVGKTEKVRIAISRTPLSAPFYIARAKNLFQKHGVNVILDEYDGGHRCLGAVLSGKAELATSSDYPIMLNSFSRSDYAVITSFVSSDNDVKLMTSSLSGITVPHMLKGKKVGVIEGGSSHYFLDRFLLFNGMRMKDVTVVPLNPEDMPGALETGKVDAISAWEPFGYMSYSRLKEKLIIFPARDYYSESFNLSGRKNYIKKAGKPIKSILHALIEAVEFINRQPQEAQQILIKAMQLDTAFVEWVWQDLHFSLGLDNSLLLTLENEAQWALKNGLVKERKVPDMKQFVVPDLLYAVDSTRVTLLNN